MDKGQNDNRLSIYNKKKLTSLIGFSVEYEYAVSEAVKICKTKGLSLSTTIPVPWYNKGYLLSFPTIMEAFIKFFLSATIKVCFPWSDTS